jgi:hypothetical protein
MAGHDPRSNQHERVSLLRVRLSFADTDRYEKEGH